MENITAKVSCFARAYHSIYSRTQLWDYCWEKIMTGLRKA